MGYHIRDGGSNLKDEIWGDPDRRQQIFDYCPELHIIMDMKLKSERCAEDDGHGHLGPSEEEKKKMEEEKKQKEEEEKRKKEEEEAKKKAEEEKKKKEEEEKKKKAEEEEKKKKEEEEEKKKAEEEEQKKAEEGDTDADNVTGGSGDGQGSEDVSPEKMRQ
jgi:hypothetical protein